MRSIAALASTLWAVLLVMGCSPLTHQLTAPSTTSAEPPSTAHPPGGPTSATTPPQENPLPIELSPLIDSPAGRKAMDAFHSKRYQECAEHLGSEEPPAESAGNPTRYLAAICTFYAGQYEDAARRLEQLIRDYPLLADYHTYFAAESWRKAGNWQRAISLARRVRPKSANHRRATLTLARALLTSGAHRKAAATLRELDNKSGLSSAAALEMARALAPGGDESVTAKAYRRVMAEWPQSTPAAAAKKALSKLGATVSKKNRAKLINLTAAEALKQAKKLFEAHRSPEAIAAFESTAKRYKKGTSQRCESLYLIGRSYDKLRKRNKAHPWYERATDECGKTEWMDDILYFSGKSHYRQAKHKRALQLFERLHRAYPRVSYNDDALLWTAYIHEKPSALAKRKKALERILKDYPRGDMRDQASWLLVWDAFRSGDMEAVLEATQRTLDGGSRERYRYSQGRTLYWRGRAHTKLKQKPEAISSFRSVLTHYPLTFYAHLAFARLVELLGQADAETLWWEIVALDAAPSAKPHTALVESLVDNPGFKKGLELLRIGMLSPAKEEFRAMGLGGKADEDWLLSALYDRAGAYKLSHNIARRKRGKFRRHYPKDTHAGRWRLAFPTPFRPLIERFAFPEGVPYELAHAIMREESGFDPKVESWANAVGLMQLLVSTARGLATNGQTVNRHTLKEPPLNIELGTRFLGKLLNRFGHVALTAAGYNAGPGAVKKWLKARGDLPLDEFVESIPFRQTRRYTKSVMSSMGTYHYLYEARPYAIPMQLPAADPSQGRP